MDSSRYRSLMRHQTGAVTIIAAGRPGARSGLTATAVSSLSDTPPTVLVCVQHRASARPIIVAERCFSVNILAREQQPLAEVFSGKGDLRGEERFATAQWAPLTTGAPIVGGALANLDCELAEEHAFATHSIFIGRVVDGRFRDDGQPLLYFRNDYWDIAAR
jgi:flavin reductase